ncbi:MAG: homocysteine S-methyltransferase family protein [Candidatus Marinimicrobia bacterium]|nr:homocysteine S-methyltransferase family protein [Candidatus Neomarinimicrobiota bacterium]
MKPWKIVSVAVANKPLIMDGAMGTELMARGLDLPLPLWSAEANLTDPEIVRGVHADYLYAGADIITTNTFRTTTWSYRKADYSPKRAAERAKSSLMKAVELAQSVNPNIVAGSLTSIEDCYEPETFPGIGAAADTYGETVEWFIEAGVDVILFETMGHLDEITVALESVENANIDIWLSLIIKDKYHLLSAHPLDAVYNLGKGQVGCLMLNCNTVEKTDQTLKSMIDNWGGDWGVYPNMGLTDPEPDGAMDEKVGENDFRKTIKKYLELDPMVIGTCCGSTPNHIETISNMIQGK